MKRSAYDLDYILNPDDSEEGDVDDNLNTENRYDVEVIDGRKEEVENLWDQDDLDELEEEREILDELEREEMEEEDNGVDEEDDGYYEYHYITILTGNPFFLIQISIPSEMTKKDFLREFRSLIAYHSYFNELGNVFEPKTKVKMNAIQLGWYNWARSNNYTVFMGNDDPLNLEGDRLYKAVLKFDVIDYPSHVISTLVDFAYKIKKFKHFGIGDKVKQINFPIVNYLSRLKKDVPIDFAFKLAQKNRTMNLMSSLQTNQFLKELVRNRYNYYHRFDSYKNKSILVPVRSTTIIENMGFDLGYAAPPPPPPRKKLIKTSNLI